MDFLLYTNLGRYIGTFITLQQAARDAILVHVIHRVPQQLIPLKYSHM